MATVAKGIDPPMSAADAYEAALRRTILKPLQANAVDRMAKAGQSYEAIRQEIIKMSTAQDFIDLGMSESAAKKHINKLKKFHTDSFKAEMRQYFGVRVDFMSDSAIAPFLDQAIRDNVDLIKTIPPKFHNGLKSRMLKLATDKPFDQQAIAQMLHDNYQSSGYNLRRLARDQTTKTIGKLTEIRQGQLDIKEYVWITSRDRSVRPTHVRNDTKTFSWANPPAATGHPGHDIQCRCIARAVIPKAEEQRPVIKPPSNALPTLQRGHATARKLAGQSGSNPGGLYEGADGVQRYVKFYSDPTQAYSEAVANRVYYEMGLNAPRSTLVYEGDKVVGVANEIIRNLGTVGKTGLTKKKATDTLQGYVTDVWLANWDAVGTGLDNIVTFRRGNVVQIARIDQGGSLLFRAQAGRKHKDILHKLTEWDNFADQGINPYYARIFDKAGVAGPDALGQKAINQIKAIKALRARTNDFQDLVPKMGGISETDRAAILQMLRKRADVIEFSLLPRIRAAMKKAREAKKAAKAAPSAYTKETADLAESYLKETDYWRGRNTALRKAPAEFKVLTPLEMAAVRAYTGSYYSQINRALVKIQRGDAVDNRKRWIAVKEVLNAALAKLPKDNRPLSRGLRFVKQSTIDEWQPGTVVNWPAFTSASADKPWGGNVLFKIKQKNPVGVYVDPISANKGERETLLPADLNATILKVDHDPTKSDHQYTIIVEVE